jgi:hypothetical protein
MNIIEISLFPTCKIPYSKSIKFDIPPVEGIYTQEIALADLPVADKKIEICGYSLACSGYYEDDYVNIYINGIIIEDTWYMREIYENEGVGNKYIVYSVPNNSIITIEFNNSLGLSNVLWFKLGLLYDE